jgi:O-antigen/teichoic acid export membrane protein
LRSKLYINSISGLIQNIFATVLLFITIPLFIKILGNDAYGVFVLVSVIGNLNMLTNIGLSTSLIKYLSEQGKCRESDNDILVSFALYIIIVSPISIVAIIFKDFILLNILKIPDNFQSDTSYLYFYLILSNTLLLIGQIASSILDSQQKIYTTNMLQILYNILYWGLIFIFLLFNCGLKEIGIPILISAFIWFIFINYYAFKYWGKINISISYHNFIRITKKQTSFGLQVYFSGLIGFFNEPFTKILISQFLGVGFISFFDISLKIRNQLWGLFGKTFHPLTPFISQLQNKEKIRNIINDLEKKILFAIIPIVIIFIFCINSFISIWIGNNTEIISISCSYVVSGYLLFSITVLPVYVFLMVKGYPSKTIIIQAQNVIVNTIIFFAFLNIFGYYSVLIANLVSVILSFFLCLYYQKKYLDSFIFDSLLIVKRLIFLFIVLFFTSYLLTILIQNAIILLFIIPFSVLLLSLIIFRTLNYFAVEDIHRYFGINNSISNITIKLLLKYNTK